MSSLFRVDLPGYLGEETESRSGYPDLTKWEGDRLLTEHASRFLDQFARQNTAELPHIRLEEHVIVVHHTAAERALYLGQAHDAPDLGSADAFDTDEHIRALERLLKLCSHFQAAGDAVGSAQEECDRISEQKERRLVRARNQLYRCCRVILLLEQKLKERGPLPYSTDNWHAEIEATKERLAAGGDGGTRAVEILKVATLEAIDERPADRLEALDAHRPRNEELAAHLGPIDGRRGYAEQWEAFVRLQLAPEKLVKLLEGQAHEQAQNLQELHDSTASLEFFRRTVLALARDDSPEARSCTVCLEEGLPLAKLAITPCAHAFCVDCLQATILKFKSCSICRQQLSAKDVRPLAEEFRLVEGRTSSSNNKTAMPPSMAASSSASSSSSSPAPPVVAAQPNPGSETVKHDKYGTKLGALVRKLQDLRREDHTAKVILFVQFDDLKRKVAAALGEFGIPAVQLQGGVAQRAGVIRDWQHNPASATFVLLLSLAQSASGTNLTAASHVVFLHPMLAPKPEMAVGYELQAIGRARRHGQRREAVHIWRFVTAGTVEQAITERHQSELWVREQARENVATVAVPADNGVSAGEAIGSEGAPAAAVGVVPSEP